MIPKIADFGLSRHFIDDGSTDDGSAHTDDRFTISAATITKSTPLGRRWKLDTRAI